MVGGIIRGRVGRSRGEVSKYLRTRSVPVKRIPPVPYIGEIWRHVYPTVQTDYESLATGSWTTGNLYAGWKMNFAASPVYSFGGEQWESYYHVLSVPEESTDTVSVILPPIRFPVDEPSSTGGNLDSWKKGTAALPVLGESLTNVGRSSTGQPLCSATLLPVSGDSHMSDGKPTRIRFDIDCYVCIYHAEHLLNGWNPTSYLTPENRPKNARIAVKYARFRKNGSPHGPLIDLTDYLDYLAAYQSQVLGNLSGYINNIPTTSTLGITKTNCVLEVFFPSYPATPALVPHLQDWEFEFVAGDTLEIDVWIELKAQPYYDSRGTLRSGSGAKKVICSVGRHVVSNSSRMTTAAPDAQWNAAHRGGSIRSVGLFGLKAADGFDPGNHTYEFTPVDGVFTFGKAAPGGSTTSLSITSQRLIWQFSRVVGIDGTPDYDTIYYGIAGEVETLELTINSLVVGSVFSFWFTGSATFAFEVTEANSATVNDFLVALNSAMVSFAAAQGADGFWETLDSDGVSGSVLTVNYNEPIGPLHVSATGGVARGTTIVLTLIYSLEMALLRADFGYAAVPEESLPAVNFTVYYRPESSGDYVDDVTDRNEGNLVSGPTGVFNHLGTTTFLRWRGTMAPPYNSDLHSSVSDFESDIPTEISVQKVNQ